MMKLLLLWIAIVPGQTPPPEGLREEVIAFLNHLQNEDLASALGLIHPDDLNNFLKLRRLPVTAWKWLSHKPLSETEHLVEVEIEREFQGKRFEVRQQQQWKKTAAGWRLRVEPPENVQRLLLSGGRTLPEELRFFPATVKFYKGANLNRAGLTIQNGLAQGVEIVSIELDAEKFEVLEAPAQVGPRSTERILLEYVGQETEENLPSSGKLRVRVEARGIEEFPFQIVYNFNSSTLEWIRKRVDESDKELPPGAPVIQPPAKPPANPRPPTHD